MLTGPESSGKTTQALALAEALNGCLVPEFARTYLSFSGNEYQYNDLKTMLLGQDAWENWHARNGHQWLVCDTDWTVYRIWEQYKFGTSRWTENRAVSPRTYYLLCAPDIPWQNDPLREHAHERDNLFALYEQLLTDIHAPFAVLQKSHEERLASALEIIRKLY